MKRIDYFDYCKGILILLVVLGHCIVEESNLHTWIYSWHMPAFFFINGVLLRKSSFINRRFWGKEGLFYSQLLKLLVPYAIYSFTLLIARWGINGFELSTLRWLMIDFITLSGVGATWFLPCIMISQLILWCISKSTKKYSSQLSGCVCILSISVLQLLALIIPSGNSLILVLLRAFAGAAFLLLGWLSDNLISAIRRAKEWFCIIIVTVCMSLYILLAELFEPNVLAINILKFGNPYLYCVNSIIGIILLLFLVSLMEKMNMDLVKKSLSLFGKNSLMIMGTHQVIMLLLRVPVSGKLIIDFLYFIFVMISEYILIIISTRVKARV